LKGHEGGDLKLRNWGEIWAGGTKRRFTRGMNVWGGAATPASRIRNEKPGGTKERKGILKDQIRSKPKKERGDMLALEQKTKKRKQGKQPKTVAKPKGQTRRAVFREIHPKS